MAWFVPMLWFSFNFHRGFINEYTMIIFVFLVNENGLWSVFNRVVPLKRQGSNPEALCCSLLLAHFVGGSHAASTLLLVLQGVG